ncbi:hypothetical protein [Actinoplanes teichomyceticus]|uniref:Uncharacterized protein n=1 Tax=Actinoplanes teichomyceticus TaxID=1867 RepID=A0A561WIR3_ACTTI|nr:hypothetical protein [Actinoplanes teichomyceticus]TWG23700.1 hypothetical protein FHX34_102251 [Actinoplanes teichomyceticus]GIF11740.1 hypothetical protein Ate01nite_17720 [Actinoplanes teichomyceticus]
MSESQGRFSRWFHETFDDMWFRSMIGPAQTRGAVQGCDEYAREQWKRDLERRKQFTREQRERKRAERAGRKA